MAVQNSRTKAGEVERLNRTALLGGVLSPCRIVAVSSKFLTSDYGATLLRRFTGAYYGFCYGACRAKRSVDATACDSLPFSRRNWQQSMDLFFHWIHPRLAGADQRNTDRNAADENRD